MGGGSSSSSSKTTTYTSQASSTSTAQVTGGAGADSPTVNAGGAVTINSDGGQVSETALAAMQKTVEDALTLAGTGTQSALNLLSNFNGAQAASGIQQQQDENALLASVLAQNSTLANNVQSGGATTGMELTTKVVLGALAVVGLIVAVLLFRK